MPPQKLQEDDREELARELHGTVYGPDDDGAAGGLIAEVEAVDYELLNEAGAVDVDAAREQAERVVRLLDRVDEAAGS